MEGGLKNIWVSVSGQIAQQRKVETIANNIANANTPGFKKDEVTFKEHLTAIDKGLEDIDVPRKEFSPDDFYRTQGAQNSHVKVAGTYTSFEQGQLEPTNNPLDLALNGKGFIEILTPNGIRYTRRGILNLNKQGELVTENNYKVLSGVTDKKPNGERELASAEDINKRIIKLPSIERLSINLQGDIYTKDGLINKISVVEFNDMHALRKEGSSLYINNDQANIKRDNIKTSINQGFVELSNVNAIKEMSELIKAHRHFDNIQKAIKVYDTITGKSVNDISKF